MQNSTLGQARPGMGLYPQERVNRRRGHALPGYSGGWDWMTPSVPARAAAVTFLLGSVFSYVIPKARALTSGDLARNAYVPARNPIRLHVAMLRFAPGSSSSAWKSGFAWYDSGVGEP